MASTSRSRPEPIAKCPTGIVGVDEITRGGVPRRRATLVCGSAGSGKTVLDVADCVLLLDHRVNDQISTRRMRVVKYRGSAHGANEYPFMITLSSDGIDVLPVRGREA
ncbi:MAG: hypothetical protein JNN08_02435 [Bryobacterales bacterium]|nr:hypothetical protein [Bryobacterales bacterium]